LTAIDTAMLTRQHSLENRGIPKVDYHCHISITEYSDPANPTIISVSKEEFIADLEEAGIDKAVVLSDKRTTPQQVADFCRQAPDRFIGFGYVNPTQNGTDEEARMQREELGLHGLKLYPCSDGYKPDDTHAFKVYEVASELGSLLSLGCPLCSITQVCQYPMTIYTTMIPRRLMWLLSASPI